MSPRKNNVLIVKDWSNLKNDKLYKGIIRKAVNKVTFLDVTIENLHPTQLGRIHEMSLPLPIRPSRYHRTCAFLIACGIDASIDGMRIDLDEVAGTTVNMRFGALEEDGSQQVDFERIEDSPSAIANTPVEESGGEATQRQSDQSEHESEGNFRTEKYDS